MLVWLMQKQLRLLWTTESAATEQPKLWKQVYISMSANYVVAQDAMVAMKVVTNNSQ